MFREFGMIGVNILSDYPYYFKEFEDRDIANSYHDQEVVLPQCRKSNKLCCIWCMKNTQPHKPNKKVSALSQCLSFGGHSMMRWDHPIWKGIILSLWRCEYEYEMPLPTVNEFTSVLKVSHSSSGLASKSKSGLEVGVSLSKRLQN